MEKLCWMCKEYKDVSLFYRDKSRYDGLFARCKECEHRFYQIKRERHKETYQEKDKRYYKKHSLKISEKNKVWASKNKFKIVAHTQVKKALRNGELSRQECEICGEKKSVAHHDDYSKPLEVRWLCQMHHMRFHHQR